MITKEEVYNSCVDLLDSKIVIAQSGMEAAQASANNETKSSAGDKYETGRAMSQNERDMYAKKLAELLGQKKILESIDSSIALSTVESGALVTTNAGTYFISISLGLVKKQSPNIVMAISAVAPIAQVMLGKAVGDSFQWQGKQIAITRID